VIAPPVDTEFFTPGGTRGDYVLAISRFVPYKRIDLAIAAAAEAEVPIVVAGEGPEERRLRSLARGHDVSFEIAPTDARLRDLYRGARAVVFPAFEDFGIVPVEAQACGTPVIALGAGGALDTVRPGVTGALVDRPEISLFARAIRGVLDDPPAVSQCRASAERFAPDRFERELKAWVSRCLGHQT
jgi:glycosyltransferase involved in cell wall biosynthesis